MVSKMSKYLVRGVNAISEYMFYRREDTWSLLGSNRHCVSRKVGFSRIVPSNELFTRIKKGKSSTRPQGFTSPSGLSLKRIKKFPNHEKDKIS
jgi:hypothetical protein